MITYQTIVFKVSHHCVLPCETRVLEKIIEQILPERGLKTLTIGKLVQYQSDEKFGGQRKHLTFSRTGKKEQRNFPNKQKFHYWLVAPANDTNLKN